MTDHFIEYLSEKKTTGLFISIFSLNSYFVSDVYDTQGVLLIDGIGFFNKHTLSFPGARFRINVHA